MVIKYQLNMSLLKGRYDLLKGYENNHITIGFGSYGQVKLAKNVQNGQTVAVKIVNKLAKNEIIFHNRLSHPKIIQLQTYFLDKERQITYMILEYADGGTLFERIKQKHPSKTEIRKYFRDICEAIAYLHSKQIMHRDIKPQNILLTKKGTAKLCDFGFAAILGQRKTLCGTYQYMSPQMVQNKPYDYKIDIWALGILLFEMISGHAPFRGNSPEEVLNEMKTKIYFNQRFEPNEINFIKKILRVTPNKRPTIFELLDDGYFQEDKITLKSTEGEESRVKLMPLEQPPVQNSESNFSKMPQNSYPFYAPKNLPRNYGMGIPVPQNSQLYQGNQEPTNHKHQTHHSPYNKQGNQSSKINSSLQNAMSPSSGYNNRTMNNFGNLSGRFS